MSQQYRPASNSQRIFISYRRSDCLPQANALHSGLLRHRPNAKVFMDLDSIPPGVDYEEHIRAAIDGCDVVLVMIGDDWLTTPEGAKARRIDEPHDVVRLEIESALASPRVRTIPVLVEGARMPDASELPESIRRLARINAIALDDHRWQADVERIGRVLESIETSSSRPVPQARPQVGYQQPSTPAYGSTPTTQGPTMPPLAPAASYPAAPIAWHPARQAQQRNFLETPGAGWVAAALPIPCCGLFNAVPLVRAGILRRHRPTMMWSLIGAGIGLELVAIVAFVVIGAVPTDDAGETTGMAAVASNVSVAVLLIAVATAVLLGILYHAPPKPVDLNLLLAHDIASRANIPLDEAEQIVSQRDLLGRFTTVEHAIAAAEVSPMSAKRLRHVGTVA